MTLGQNIQSLRKKAGLSQEGLGSALGVSRQAVSKWESDSAIPELDTLIAMSRLFGITLGTLLLIEPAEDPPRQTDMPAAEAGAKAAPSSEDRAADRLEALLTQYTAQSQQQKQRQTKYRRTAAALGALLLLGGSLYITARFRELHQSLRQVEGRLSVVSSSVDHQISAITGQISDLLEEQDNILSDSRVTLAGVDIEKGAVLCDLSATLKTVNTASTGRFLLCYTDDHGENRTVESDPCPGPVFSTKVWLPYNIHTEVLLVVDDPDGQQRTQRMDTIYDAAADYYRFSGSAHMGYTAHPVDDSHLRLVLDGAYTIWRPDLPDKLGMTLTLQDIRAEIYHNNTLVQTIALAPSDRTQAQGGKNTTTAEIAPPAGAASGGTTYTFPAPAELTLALRPGDIVKTIFSFTDNYGRVTYAVGDHDKAIEIQSGKSGLEIRAVELTEAMLPQK